MTGARTFDVVLFGATGVTGTQAVRYLAERSKDSDLRWAIAGRDAARLADVAAEFAPGTDCLVADVEEPATLDALAADTTVVANLVGPYARHGTPVYEACIRNGTHEVDACGEMDWLRTQIKDLDAAAIQANVRIVHTAGFEALPFDLGARQLAEHFAADGSALVDVDVAIAVRRDPPITSPVDLLSGGTLASGADGVRRGNVEALRDARYLDPTEHQILPFDVSARRHAGTGDWLGPMVPSPHINPAIAHRTEFLLRQDGCFGASYRFREGLIAADLIPGLSGSLSATVVAIAQQWNTAMTAAPSIIRSWAADTAEFLGPKPGNGPDESRLDGWSWRLDFRGADADGGHADLVVQGEGHPGYRSSANLVAETAVALATDAALDATPGLRTPAAALGADGTRFEAAGLRFSPVKRVD